MGGGLWLVVDVGRCVCGGWWGVGGVGVGGGGVNEPWGLVIGGDHCLCV